ncbi:MAG: alpha/beta fold hydrolase [Gammaproteobacteria bacterium]|jgi:fermentation-respiration switch protein FrsA (DUF1100 family)|nr:alpha/beta fold hydrolase [Gammaproteobacteria bacterium]
MARLLLTRSVARTLALLVMATVLAGCGRVFFYPQRILPFTPEAADLVWEDVWLRAADGVALHAWYLPAEGETRGTVLYLHGNGGNVATQLPAVYWLPARGYAVLMPDYRGYGRSQGSVSIEGAMRDVQAALAWLAGEERARTQGVVVLGQSLGGALAVQALVRAEQLPPLRGVVLDSSFASFRRIAREKLDQFWLTWPLQWPLAMTIPDRHSPVRAIAALSPVPVLIIHGAKDPIVPFEHGAALYRAAREPRELWRIPLDGHIAAFTREEYRERMTAWLDRAFDAARASVREEQGQRQGIEDAGEGQD